MGHRTYRSSKRSSSAEFILLSSFSIPTCKPANSSITCKLLSFLAISLSELNIPQLTDPPIVSSHHAQSGLHGLGRLSTTQSVSGQTILSLLVLLTAPPSFLGGGGGGGSGHLALIYNIISGHSQRQCFFGYFIYLTPQMSFNAPSLTLKTPSNSLESYRDIHELNERLHKKLDDLIVTMVRILPC
jgi:hypothetical protein